MVYIEPWLLLGVWSAVVTMWWIESVKPAGFALSVIARVPGMRPAELTVRIAPVATLPSRAEDPTEAEPDVDVDP